MRYEDLKIHIAEVERCQKPTQTKSVPPVLFPENLWENETVQLKPWDRQRGSITNNIHILTLDVFSLTAYSPVSPWSTTTSYSRTSPGFPDSPRPYPQEMFLQGHMEVDKNGKMSSCRTYNWHNICWRWSDLLMQDHTFLRHSMEYQHLTINWWWLSIIKYLLILSWWNCLPAMTSTWYFNELLRNETQNFLNSKLCFPWLVYTLTPSNSTHYYLISSNLPFTTETTKKFPAEKKTTENLRTYSVTWQSTFGEYICRHQRA